jgi:putative transposase
VVDFTCVATLRGLSCALAIDILTRRISDWRVSRFKRADLEVGALDKASYNQVTERPLIHFGDLGHQELCITQTKLLAVAGIEPSVGRRGESYANELAESIIGLRNMEVNGYRRVWKGVEGH